MRQKFRCGYDANGQWQCIPAGAGGACLTAEKPIAPQFIPDDMPATRHPCDGQFYTSKAKFRETTRAHGKIEVGNEQAAFMAMKPTGDNRPPMQESIKNTLEFYDTLRGKSEGERREIEARFHNMPWSEVRERFYEGSE
jgi:hypothetical protein